MKANISQAYLHIFQHLLRSNTPYTLVNYESLASYPKAQHFLLEQIGLELPERRWPIYDGNRKWHDLKPADDLARLVVEIAVDLQGEVEVPKRFVVSRVHFRGRAQQRRSKAEQLARLEYRRVHVQGGIERTVPPRPWQFLMGCTTQPTET